MDEVEGTPQTGGSKAERKKARRRARRDAETAEAKRLEETATVAIESALRLAAEVAAAPTHVDSERVIDVSVTTLDAARFIRKRINEALSFDEWLDEVEAWVWEAETSTRPAMTESGERHGVELRLEQVSPNRSQP